MTHTSDLSDVEAISADCGTGGDQTAFAVKGRGVVVVGRALFKYSGRVTKC